MERPSLADSGADRSDAEVVVDEECGVSGAWGTLKEEIGVSGARSTF